ncbi:hypothetical protein OPU71_16665 [Niveibacterium sp. 24ML]|uniref:WD40/YVTN/BNR-like repeat-containing protein n=1 Tax=Niveibacterium sp. 24ML TaxID=2985512 RepID=UPI00226FFF3B|nr:hypothetical protein [Niveibacterium sp. 24ML]MCX9157759.1 hypothetical protein [Niveibacterium sp. 24ML]
MIHTRSRALMLASLTSLALLAGCGGGDDNKPAVPTGFKVTPGDARVYVEWTQEPNLTYWLFSAQGEGLTRSNYRTGADARIQTPVYSGFARTGLVNGLKYSFFLNATDGASAAGDETATWTVTPRPAGDNWQTPSEVKAGTELNAVSVFNSRFVAVGADGAVFLSFDSKAWEASSVAIPTSKTLYGIGVSGSLAVAVGADGTILTSTDAITWTARTSPVTTTLRSVAAGPDAFIAVGDGGVVVRSTDGVTWTALEASAKPAGLTANLRSVKNLNGTVVIVGDNGTVIQAATTADLSTGLRAAATSENLRDVSFGASTYVAVGSNGTVIASRDGSTWYPQINLPVSGEFSAIGIGSRFMAIGANGLAAIAVVKDASAANAAMLSWSVPTPSADESHVAPSGNMNAIVASSAGYVVARSDGKVQSAF